MVFLGYACNITSYLSVGKSICTILCFWFSMYILHTADFFWHNLQFTGNGSVHMIDPVKEFFLDFTLSFLSPGCCRW